MTRRFVGFVLICAALCGLFIIPAGAYVPSDFELRSEAALLYSRDTDITLYTKNADKRMYPASLTKLMTAALVVENIPDIDTDTITVSQQNIKDIGTDSSTGGFKADETVTMRQMLQVFLMASANEGALALAEKISGSVDAFVGLMNQKAAALGMNSTHYVNPHGLHDDNHYTTANDLLKLTNYVLSLPHIYDICSTVHYRMAATNKNPERPVTTTNLMMLSTTNVYYKEARGLKTGFTSKAGHCLITTASRGGFSYIAIVMGAPPQNAQGKAQRVEFGDCKNLFEWAFNDFVYKTLLLEDEPLDTVKVNLCWENDTVNAVPVKSFAGLFPKSGDASVITKSIKLDAREVDAPVKKGDRLGTVYLSFAGDEIGTVELVAAESRERNQMLAIVKFAGSVLSSPILLTAAGIVAVLILTLVIWIVLLNRKRTSRRSKPKYKI